MIALVNTVRTVLSTVDTIFRGLNLVKSRMDTMEDWLSALEQAGGSGGYGGGGGGSGQSQSGKRRAAEKRKREAAAL